MSDTVIGAPAAGPDATVLKRLSTLEKFLPVWIIAAMALGIGLGRAIPALAGDLDKVQIGSVSLPIAVGLLLMMYPVLAKVRYTQLELACGDRDAAAVLVAINSVFQIVAFAGLGWFYLQVLPRWLGLSTTSADLSITAIAVSVLVFLGIPLVAGYLTRTIASALIEVPVLVALVYVALWLRRRYYPTSTQHVVAGPTSRQQAVPQPLQGKP